MPRENEVTPRSPARRRGGASSLRQKTRWRLVPAWEDEASPHSCAGRGGVVPCVGRRGVASFLYGERRRRLVQRGEGGVASSRGGSLLFRRYHPIAGSPHTGILSYRCPERQAVPPTIWYRLVAGLNAQLRLVRRGHLKVTFMPILSWLETHANPSLRQHGICIDLAWFQATTLGYCQLGLVVYAVQGETETYAIDGGCRTLKVNQILR
ncbi:hypothetical protein BHE74_00016932 [Ensete ventricosum]|nr:hypothetical protein GW17_00022868 [Ensete ventricosum]RWW75064.1 hypothetical protein BHE74_00016932 [Ensete ventricosum]RZS16859.1 hypothetical protein BHM03_00048926 [Ensete ventricosum]